VDGVPLNDPSGISGGAYDLRLISLDQVERIEILKGSQSTLYGSDAIAGVINIITKKGTAKPIEFAGTVGYGSYQTSRANAAIQGNIRKVGYAISYSLFNTDGISEAAEKGTTPFDKDGATQQALQTSFDFKPTGQLSIKPFLRYSKFKGQYDGGAYYDDPLNTYAATLINTGAQASYSLKNGGINLQYAYDESDRTYDGTYGKNEYFGKFHHTELFSNYTLSKHLQLLTGLTQQYYKMLDKTATEADPSVTIFSPYVSLFGKTGNLSVEIGGRYNHHTNFGNNFTYSFNPSFQFTNGLKIFFNTSTGFKAPSLYQLYGLYGANPELKPEQSLSNEVGAQWLSANNKWELRAVAFTRKIQDVIVYLYPANLNLDQQNDHGFEWESTVKLNKRMTAKAFYSFVDGEVKSKISGNDTTYHNLFRRPKHMVGVNIGYQISNQSFVSLNARWFGKRSDLYFDMDDFTNHTTTLDGYALVDLYGEHQFKKIKTTVFVDLKNILNANYQEVYGYNTMGLNIHAGIRVRR
jgi:vitamin B12 transporter